MNQAQIQVELIADLTVEDVHSVYSGRPKAGGRIHCRCGCCGTYRYNGMHYKTGQDPDRGYVLEADEINVPSCLRILKAVQDHVKNGGQYMLDAEFIDIELPSGRCYTVYFMKGKVK